MKLSIFEKIYYKLSSFWYFIYTKRRIDKFNKTHKYRDAILETHPILYWPMDGSGERCYENKSNQLSDHFKEDAGSLWAWSGKVDNIKTFDHALTPEIVEECEKWKKSKE